MAAQTKRANHWYFGYKVGVDFNTTPPTVTTDSPINQLEGTAVMSDESGQLLFYTDGLTVWDKQHTPMPNGGGLLGGNSSSQSALVIPKPGSEFIYFIFTTPDWSSMNATGVRYSTVDMRLNNGRGDILAGQKNIPLLSSSTEKLAAIYHSNGKDVWLVTSRYNTNQFYAYLVTEEGVCDCPVISSAGQIQTEYQGCLKFAPNGTKLVSAEAANGSQLFNFDACDGRVTYVDKLPLDLAIEGPHYGASFSPDNTKLYITCWPEGFKGSTFWQYDMQAPGIAGSRTFIADSRNIPDSGSCMNASAGFGQLQIGPDSKIYVANYIYCFYHVLTNPNGAAPDVGFVKEGLYAGFGQLGLPNFIESYFNKTPTVRTCTAPVVRADFQYADTCRGQKTQFRDVTSVSPEISLCYNWNFGDPASGVNNASSSREPAHVFSAPGAYRVTLTVKEGTTCRAKSVSKLVTILPSPEVALGADTTLCQGDVIRLDVHQPDAQYRWQDNSVEPSLLVQKPGTYWVDVTRGNCTTRDSINVHFVPPPLPALGNDTVVCRGEKLTLHVAQAGLKYRWQDGTREASYTVTAPGLYWVELSNAACNVTDSIRVTYDTSRVELGKDTTLCLGEQLKLTVPHSGLDYRWSTTSTDADIFIEQAGVYWLAYKQPGGSCWKRDSIRVSFQECFHDLLIPNVITPNGDQFNETFQLSGAKGTAWDLILYNRWGKQVGKYAHYQNDWNAHGLDNGIYYYVLISRISGRSFKGWIQVLR